MSQLIIKFIKQIMKAPKIASRFLVLGIFAFVFFGQVSGDNFLVVGKAEAANITLSGTLYTDAGVTTAGASKTIKIAVGTSTPSIHSTTTISNGTWQITNIDNASLSSTTPFTIWLDGDANDATTMVMGYSGSNITSIPLYYAYTIAHGTSSSATLDVGKFSFYDVDDDADILYKISATSTTVASNLLIKQGTFSAPTTTLSISGNYQNDGTFSHNYGSIFLTGVSKTIDGKLSGTSALYNLRVNGSYTVATSTASTTDILISSSGSLVAPASLTVTGSFTNRGTFDNNDGTLYVQNAQDEIIKYLAGRDARGDDAGSGNVLMDSMIVKGDYMYVTKGGSASACNQTAGATGVQGCELMVFDISSSTNPIYVAGRDALGDGSSATGSRMYSLAISGNTLYVGKTGNTNPCSQTAGETGVNGCELQVYDISSSTNPTYVAGRDVSGDSTGTATGLVYNIITVGNYLYLAKAGGGTACSQTAGSAIGCELQVYDISSSTNPIYVAGRDTRGDAGGSGSVAMYHIKEKDGYLYIAKAGNGSTCSQTAGATGVQGCELMVFDISSSTNPVYVAGRDSNGASNGTGIDAINNITIYDNFLYLGKVASTTACSQTAGSAIGCELQVYDISSSTNPIYVAGRDSDGSSNGVGVLDIKSLSIANSKIYVGKDTDNTACSQTAGSADGCELMVFEISSSTNPTYIAGRDASGSATGGGSNVIINSVINNGSYVYVTKGASATACSQTAGSADGCELMVFSSLAGLVSGNINNSNSMAGLSAVDGFVKISDTASTTNLTIATSSTLTAPDYLTVTGDLSNYGTFTHSSGTVILSGTSQDLISPATTTFYNLTKSVSSADTLTFTAGGTYEFDGTLTLNGASSNLLSLRSSVPTEYWYIDPQATTTVSYLDVQDSNNINVTTITCDTGCVNSGNNINWSLPELSSVLSGIIYSGVGTTEYTAGGKTIKVVVDGTDSYTDTLSGGSGAWSVNAGITASSIITIYVDNDPAFRASLVTKAASESDITNLHLYQDHLIIRSEEGTSTPITNATLATYDSSDDSDIQFTATSSTLVQTAGQSLYIYNNTNYLPGGEVTVGKSLIATSTAVTSFSTTTFNFIATSTATITAPTTFGNLNFNSATGDWNFTSDATTTDFIVLDGTTTAPTNLVVTGNFANRDTFDSNTGTIYMQNAKDEVISYLVGRDARGDDDGLGGPSIYAMVVSGNYLYASKSGSVSVCSQTAGAAGVQGCEIMVFDISSTTNPIYVAGRDASGDNSGIESVAIRSLVINGNYLYAGKNTNATACSQTAGSAIGCELMVFDISSSTNPIYVAGRDASGDNSGTGAESVNQMVVVGNYIYLVKDNDPTACSQTAGSAIGCELMVFDISSSTNPIYVAGRDSRGDDSGAGSVIMETIISNGNYLYIGKAPSATACSQTAGNAGVLGCELMVFDISSSTNPIYVAGRDVSGDDSGTGSLYVNAFSVSGNYLYVGKDNDPTACSQTAGSAIGCELMVFDISSSTNPIYVAGRDSDGSSDGTNTESPIATLLVEGSNLYVGKDISTCYANSSCELMVFDISSSTNPTYGGGINGTGGMDVSEGLNSITLVGDYLYVSKDGSTTACSQTAGSAIGCELTIFSLATGLVSGILNDTNALSNFSIRDGKIRLLNTASTTNLTIATSSTLTAPDYLTVTGDLSNYGTFTHSSGTVILSGTSQDLISPATTTFYNLTKSVSSADTLTFTAGGTYITQGELTLTGASGNRLSLRSSSTTGEWYIDPQATTTVSYLDVQDSNNINVTTITCDTGCVDGGRNTNWDFSSLLPVLSGIIYSGVGTSEYTSGGKTIKVVVDGTDSYTDTLSGGSGAWSVNADVATGSVVTIYVDGDATFRASLVTRAMSTDDITNLHLYQDHLIIRSEEGTSTPITNATLATYDSSDDSDIQFTATSSTLVQTAGQSLYVYSNTNYLPGGEVTVGKSLIATSTAVTSFSTTTFNFIATSTATITAPTTFGNLNFNSATGDWNFTSDATTTDFIVLDGTTTAPTNLTVTGNFINNDIFDSNAGTIYMDNPQDEIISYLAGRDSKGDDVGTGSGHTYSFAVSGDYLYVGKAGAVSACSQTAGTLAASYCELHVYNISSSTNPIYVAGRDSDGSSTGTLGPTINTLTVSGNYLYVGKVADTTACDQAIGSADGCELMVFDISSSTNPIYVAGLDSDGSSTGTLGSTINTLTVSGNYLYVGKAQDVTACTQTAGSADGCELMVFDISSSTNPIYVAGRDAKGDAVGTGVYGINSLFINNNYLYVGKDGSVLGCSQTAGSVGASYCALHVYDISSSTNPIYVAGRDSKGSTTGTSGTQIVSVTVSGAYLYVGKTSNATACSQTAGSADGCELMVFDISSSTNPIYVAGLDSDGSSDGILGPDINTLTVSGNYLYIGKVADGTVCSQTAGSADGCELMVFDISSSTNPIYVAGLDSDGSSDGSTGYDINYLNMNNDYLYVVKNSNVSACSQTAGSAYGCELQIFSAVAGVVRGSLTADSNLSDLSILGTTRIIDNASTTDLSVVENVSLEIVDHLTITGSYINNGTTNFNPDNYLYINSNSIQAMSGNFTATSTLPNTIFSGSGTKTMSDNASTTSFTIDSGATVISPASLTVFREYNNNGTFDHNGGTVEIKSYISNYVAGRDSSGNSTGTLGPSINAFTISGDYLYVGKLTDATACTQTAGSADGCELMVFDISSSTNPIYVAGRDSSGNSTGTLGPSIQTLTISGDYLYVGKLNDATACTQTAGSADGCELMVFDISSSTNPIYVAGLDSDGSSNGTLGPSIQTLTISGDYLYVGKLNDATACSQSAGSADGCELMVFDISSSTNPIYVAGLDSDGSSDGTLGPAINTLAVSGNYLYVGKTGDVTACSQSAGSADGCELMVFDISSLANPVYKTGRDASGSDTGAYSYTVNTIEISGDYLYVGKIGVTSACSQTAGSAISCELMVFDISSSTNPTYVAGRDSDSSNTGATGITIKSLDISGNYLYVGKAQDTTACTQIAGSAVGCELQIYDTSSSTNPIYVAGRDSDGSSTGIVGPTINTLAISGNYLYVGKVSDTTACDQAIGSADGCELMVFDLEADIKGDLIGTNAFNSLTVSGFVDLLNTASTTNLTIATSSTLTAPDYLTVTGDLSNYGTFTHSSGTVILSGTSQDLISPATTTFYNLTKSVTSADTLTFTAGGTYITQGELTLTGASGNRLSLRSSSTTGEWYIDPQATTTVSYLDVKDSNNINVTTITCDTGCVDGGRNTNWNIVNPLSFASADDYHFYVGQATTTLDQIILTKQSSSTNIVVANDIRISIATTTTDFRFDTGVTTLTFGGTASGKVSNTVSYEHSGATLVIDVTENFVNADTLTINGIQVGSFASISTTSSNLRLYTSGSINGDADTVDEKNINITGSITVGDHTLGQVDNQFSFQNVSDEAMFAFSMSPSGENATVTDMVITLSGIQGVDESELTDFKLYRDNNSDRAIDGSDTLLDGAGILTINDQHGAITFSSDFLVSNEKDYIMTADTSVIDKGDTLVIRLPITGITTVGTSSNYSSVIIGTPSEIQHERHGSSAGGSSARIGDDAPAGNGIVTGGDESGGGGAGQGSDGENIASDPDFMRPTATGDVHNEWTNPNNALLSDGTYATAGSNGLRQSYSGFSFGIAGGNTIQGIAVKLDASGSTADGTIDVSLSWDGGNSYTTAKATPTLSGSDIVYTVGGASDTWGRSWSVSEFDPANFLIRVSAVPSSNTLRLDALEIKVYHQTGGGGAGGGSGGGGGGGI